MKEITTLLDAGKSTLEIGGAVYQIDRVAACGGLSIVYKAHRLGSNEASVIVKEYWPHQAGAKRASNGSLVVPTQADACYQALVYRESNAAQELRRDTKDGFANDWFQKYSQPLKANETVYTVIEAISGDMLSELIEGKTYGLAEACEQVLRVAEALAPIHQKGYLHLDIKPENVHVSDMSVDRRRAARLIDYNTAWKISESPPEITTSSKGYSANELASRSHLSFATDIYSLAAMLFRLLAGHVPLGRDISTLRFKTWTPERCMPSLAGMSEVVVNSVRQFLADNLSVLPKNRCQTLDEFRQGLENLIALASKPTLANFANFEQRFTFVGRESELSDIDSLLDKSNWLIVSGERGIGKTELVRAYANRQYGKRFDTVQLVSFGESLMETALRLKIHGFDYKRYQLDFGQTAQRRAFRDILGLLSGLGKRTLIIVDGYNALDDPDFTAFVSGECRIIFTSNINFSKSYELQEIESDDALVEIFALAYYGERSGLPANAWSDPEKAAILGLISRVERHTMMVALIAKTMRQAGKRPTEMLEIMRRSIKTDMPKVLLNKFGVSPSQKERDIYSHARALYNIAEAASNPECASIMTNLSILPPRGLDPNRFREWTGLADLSAVENLNRLGWVDLTQNAVKLHAIASDVAFVELKPDSVKCRQLIEGMTSFADFCASQTYVERGEAIETMRVACERITDPSEALVKMLRSYIVALNGNGRYSQAVKAGELLESVSYQVDLPQDLDNVHSMLDKAVSYIGAGQADFALAWVKRADEMHHWLEHQIPLELDQGRTRIWRLYIKIYTTANEDEKALEFIEQAERRIFEWAMTHYYKGLIALKRLKFIEALKHFEFSLAQCDIFEDEIPERHETYACSLSGKGKALANLGRAKEALPILTEAVARCEALFGDTREETAEAYNSMARAHIVLGNVNDAVSNAEKACAIYESSMGSESVWAASAFACLGGCHHEKGDLAAAQKCLDRAFSAMKSQVGDDHFSLADIHTLQGIVCLQAEDTSKALEHLEKALEIRKKANRLDDSLCCSTYMYLATACYGDRQIENGVERFRQCLELSAKLLISGDCDLLIVSKALSTSLGYYLYLGGEREISKDAFDAAFLAKDIIVRELGETSEEAGDAFYCLGKIYFLEENRDAKEMLAKAVTAYEANPSIFMPDALLTIGIIDTEDGNPNAVGELNRAISLMNETEFPENRMIAHALLQLGINAYDEEEFGKALDLYQRAESIFQTLGYGFVAAGCLVCIAEAQYNLGQCREGLASAKKALLYFKRTKPRDKESIGDVKKLISEIKKYGARGAR
ncbi:MAG: tetratricopeptide repeat protein [Clostridiales bacterium]|nr:tetratricopeptide repeat protein [Clostridiales bacterium]